MEKNKTTELIERKLVVLSHEIAGYWRHIKEAANEENLATLEVMVSNLAKKEHERMVLEFTLTGI